ncbi:MAG: hypothetical protein AB7O59_15025 [Pirellulales bacterium]
MPVARLALWSTVIMAMLVVSTRLGNPFCRRMRMVPAAPKQRVCKQDGGGQ